jgi:hypothetical protein
MITQTKRKKRKIQREVGDREREAATESCPFRCCAARGPSDDGEREKDRVRSLLAHLALIAPALRARHLGQRLFVQVKRNHGFFFSAGSKIDPE